MQIRLYDVIGRSRPELQHVVESIVPEGLYEIVFHFTPNFNDIRIETKPYETEDYIFFCEIRMGAFGGRVFFPIPPMHEIEDGTA